MNQILNIIHLNKAILFLFLSADERETRKHLDTLTLTIAVFVTMNGTIFKGQAFVSQHKVTGKIGLEIDKEKNTLIMPFEWNVVRRIYNCERGTVEV